MVVKRFFILFFFLFVIQTICSAQLLDTLRNGKPKIGIIAGLDLRYSFIDRSFKQPVLILGGRGGIRYKRWKYWGGFYSTFVRSRIRAKDPTIKKGNPEVNRDLTLYFGTACVEYIFFDYKWVEFSVPVEIGLGESKTTYVNLHGNKMREIIAPFVPTEIGLFTLIKPTRWIGFTLKVGYRKTLRFSRYTVNYDGLYYGATINLFLENIYADFKKMTHKKK